MDVYPDDNEQGVMLMANDEVSFIDLLYLPDSLIVKLNKLGKFDTRKIAASLNNDTSVTILF